MGLCVVSALPSFGQPPCQTMIMHLRTVLGLLPNIVMASFVLFPNLVTNQLSRNFLFCIPGRPRNKRRSFSLPIY